jgi:ethanolamine transporter EutH
MDHYHSIPEILLLVVLLSAGTVLFLVVRKVIEQWAIFRGTRAAVAAFSIACLVVASIAMLLLVPGQDPVDGGQNLSVNFALLPGVAVAGTIILLQLFMIAGATTPIKVDETAVGQVVHKSPRSESPAKPAQKGKATPKPSKQTAKPPAETAKKTEDRS